MQVQIQKTEQGLTLLIPEEFVHGSHVAAGSTVDLTLIDGKILVAPVRRSKYRIEDLMARVTEDNLPEKIDFGPPVGKELL